MSTLVLLLAPILGANMSFTPGVSSIGLAMAFVSVAAIGSFMGRVSQFFRGPKQPENTELEAAVHQAVNSRPIDPHLIAILTTAATVALGYRVVLRRVTFINQDTVSGWAEAGRNSIHLSHNLRRNTL